MNINDMTIGEIKEIQAMVGGQQVKTHPLNGKAVVAILPNGFIYFGVLDCSGGYYSLTKASNIRYWSKRDGGLPELIRDGLKSDDRIDKCSGPVVFESFVSMLECGGWDE